jgi:asparagine synthase (glutamine-hydrolysing)
MATADGRYSITFNGEIYNYLDLRKRLEDEGVEFNTNTDTEVMLRLFAKRGAGCLAHLRGMFAFAIRDDATGELFAARDRLGIKPFYYYTGGDCFAFASEVRALLASRLVPRALDYVSVNSLLSFGAVQEPRTIIEGVRSLPPGYFIRVSSEGRVVELSRYWALPRNKQNVDRAAAIAETRARLDESVRLHLMSDVPLGAFLSSGIDSSSIVALMSRHAPGRVKTFTVVFKEGEFSERELSRRVAERWGTAHTEIALSESDMLKELPEALSGMDQPTIDGVNTWIISRATRRAGITVALSGLGGDELFGGYPSFQRAASMRRTGRALGLLGHGVRRQIGSLVTAMGGGSLAVQKMSAAIEAGSDPLSLYACSRGLFSRESRNALLKTTATPRSPYDIPEETLALLDEHHANGDAFNRVSLYEMALYMGNMLLRDTDAMSMASALEVRVPLIDHELVEWVYALPEELKIGRTKKALLVEAMGDDLFAEVSRGVKKGFALPFERWLHTALRPFLSDTLNDEVAVGRAGLDGRAVADVVNRFDERSPSTSWSRVWGLAVLVDWCRTNGVEPVG